MEKWKHLKALMINHWYVPSNVEKNWWLQHQGREGALGREVQRTMIQKDQLVAVGSKSKKIQEALFCIIPAAAAAAAKSHQSCPTLCDPIDGSPTGSSVPGILQARILEWVAISFSNAWKWNVKVKLFSHVQLLATPWTVAYQAPRSMGFSRQEYWSGVPLPSLLKV